MQSDPTQWRLAAAAAEIDIATRIPVTCHTCHIYKKVARLHTQLLLLNVYSSLFLRLTVMSVSNALANKLHHGQPVPENPYRQGDDNYEAYERCR